MQVLVITVQNQGAHRSQEHELVPDTTAIIFAGGLGTRLGNVKKALLDIGGVPIIDRVLAAVRPMSNDVIVVDNDDSLAYLPAVRVVPDTETRAGVLTALYSGLAATSSTLCIVVACDMPFLDARVLHWLVERATADVDVVIPVVDGQMDPMHAVYRRERCLDAIGRALARGDKRMISYLGEVRVREVTEGELRALDPDLRSLFNINTPEDLDRARALAA
jgi:molybdopterin-guanine dinucleotide biosynthesis protein A